MEEGWQEMDALGSKRETLTLCYLMKEEDLLSCVRVGHICTEWEGEREGESVWERERESRFVLSCSSSQSDTSSLLLLLA